MKTYKHILFTLLLVMSRDQLSQATDVLLVQGNEPELSTFEQVSKSFSQIYRKQKGEDICLTTYTSSQLNDVIDKVNTSSQLNDVIDKVNTSPHPIVFCAGASGRSVLDEIAKANINTPFSGVLLSFKMLVNHLCWLRPKDGSTMPDVIILPANVVTAEVLENIQATQANLIKIPDVNNIDPKGIAEELYTIYFGFPAF